MSENVKPEEKLAFVTSSWDGKKWDIVINDFDGTREITPREKNLLFQQLKMQLNRRYRHLRVKARVSAKV